MMKIVSARRFLVFALLIFSLTLFACGDSDNMGNEEHEHVAGEWKVTTPPTKNKNGVRSSVCTICNAELTETIDKVAPISLEILAT